MNTIAHRAINFHDKAVDLLARSHSVVAVLVRLYLAHVFFNAGLTKINDWETTLFLFEYEYAVPLLSSEISAFLATAAELVLPVLLVAGLLTRVAAFGLFVLNIVAVISLQEIAVAALYLHILWGILLAQVVLYGAGYFALSRLVLKRFRSTKV
ncbi:DoxX family protein [Marinagarivorans cellulosilyticus]|uniref:Oxidoreductase n=1 Tax=Marinagarivorans cellulosilyticus TaxID=2721545 RepID=A0AAN1WFC2_9GAMM|nr:DoxX family protein [Marinagarivorans cellulosilyticus]BCD96485.1 putative oxidoreductase [Marinagarivorans cellulosilyticus]